MYNYQRVWRRLIYLIFNRCPPKKKEKKQSNSGATNNRWYKKQEKKGRRNLNVKKLQLPRNLD